MIRGLNKITEAAGLGYVMSSYTSHPVSFREAESDAKKVAADLLQAGLVVFAPIAYGPGIEPLMSNGFAEAGTAYFRSHEFWMPICERFFQRCDYGIIATTPGWNKSKGIAIEYGYLIARGVPLWFYDIANDRILSIGEAYDEWPEEMEDLDVLSEDEGLPSYLQASHE